MQLHFQLYTLISFSNHQCVQGNKGSQETKFYYSDHLFLMFMYFTQSRKMYVNMRCERTLHAISRRKSYKMFMSAISADNIVSVKFVLIVLLYRVKQKKR